MSPPLPFRFFRMFFGAGLLGLIAGCGGKPDVPPDKPPPAPVKWELPGQVELAEWTELIGTTQALPNRAARITSPVEGRVAAVLTLPDGKSLMEGATVKAGTVLIRLDSTIIQANRDRAAAALKALDEEHKQTQLVVDLAAKRVERLTALQEKDLQRARDNTGDIGRVRLVTPVEMEEAQNARLVAESQLRGARLKHEAGLKERDALEAQLRLYDVTSPINGRISRVQVTPGQTVSVGTLLIEVVDPGPEIDVLCFVPSSIARRLKVGQEARLGGLDKAAESAVSGPKGTVQFIAPQGDSDTGSFAVKARFANDPTADGHLRANAVLRLRVMTQAGKPCLSIPEGAVLEDQEKPMVIVVQNLRTEKNKDTGKEEQFGEAVRLQVKLGYRDRDRGYVEILELTDPEKKWQGTLDETLFITEGIGSLQNGDAVKLIVEEDEPMPAEEKKAG